MANGHGGPRTPNNPAPVSGPGRLSQRTDGAQGSMTLPDAKYGENAAFQAAQSAAPMSESAGGMGAPAGMPAFAAPTERPDESIMAGMPGGDGAGPSIPMEQGPKVDPETAERLRSYLPVLLTLASRDDADSHTRQFVRQLRADLG